MRILAQLTWLVVCLPLTLYGHPQEATERIRLQGVDVVGTMLDPHAEEPVPLAILVGGTMSQDRNGRLLREAAPPRDALRRLADAFLAGGYACFRFDPVGSGASQATIPWTNSYRQQAAVVRGLVEHYRADSRFSQLILLGESAGAYVICLAAEGGTHTDATVFLGAYCGEPEELYEYNFGRLVRFAEQSSENAEWVKKHARTDLALGKHYRQMFAAARAGNDFFELHDDELRISLDLTKRKEELAAPAPAQFRHLKSPLLLLAGERDRNVPPEHATRAAAIVHAAGNEQVTATIIPAVDHSFQIAPADEQRQIHNRYSFASFRQPYSSATYWAILKWLDKYVPTPLEEKPELVEMAASRVLQVPAEARALQATEVDPVTDSTPKRIFLAKGVEIVPDITDRDETAGVETLEGRIGPLILGEGCQAHFIEMPGGMYVEEHPHSSESLIYTVKGEWVLCSDGRRNLMRPGTLFRFAANTPTGYEVPFAQPAHILIFKGDRVTKVESDFIQYLQGMAARLEREHRQGVPFLLRELPIDHAARKFGRDVNVRFDQELGIESP